MDGLRQSSIDLILALQRLSPGFDPLMSFLSFLGMEEFFLLFTTALYWCVSPAWGMRALALLVLSDSLNGIVKWLFHEPRPYWMSPQVRGLAAEPSYGIPSGHAQTGIAFWGLHATVLGRAWAWPAALLLVAAISLSRLYLGVHFLHDVVVGWALGALLLLVYLRVERPLGARIASWPLASQIAAAFAGSLAIAAMSLLVRSTLATIADPVAWAAQAASTPRAAGLPAIDPRSLTGGVATWGAMFGIGAGWALARRFARFDPGGPWMRRMARWAVGLAIVMAVRIGLAAVFPSGGDAVALAFRYVRYALMALAAVWLAPWLFLRLRLARPIASGRATAREQSPWP